MRMHPSTPPSSSPTACNMVDLPDPDGPSSATISPSPTFRSTPRSTSMVTPPCVKLRVSPVTFRTSFITQHLHGIGIGGLERRVKRREETEDERHQADDGDFHRIGLGRQFR